eukprot:11165707-Lingulodinium_polyedra.AAC.1
MLRNDAVESTVRGRSGSRIARSRTPRARQFAGAPVECASVRFAAVDGRCNALSSARAAPNQHPRSI